MRQQPNQPHGSQPLQSGMGAELAAFTPALPAEGIQGEL
jgi:hypothetical protein